MKKRIIDSKIIVEMIVFAVMFFIGYFLYSYFDKENNQMGQYYSQNEYVRTINLNQLIDSNPGKKIAISFWLRVEKEGQVMVYQYNNNDCRYSFSDIVNATTEYQKYTLVVDPILVDEKVYDAYLAFYGYYDTGVIPHIKDIETSVLY